MIPPSDQVRKLLVLLCVATLVAVALSPAALALAAVLLVSVVWSLSPPACLGVLPARGVLVPRAAVRPAGPARAPPLA